MNPSKASGSALRPRIAKGDDFWEVIGRFGNALPGMTFHIVAALAATTMVGNDLLDRANHTKSPARFTPCVSYKMANGAHFNAQRRQLSTRP